MVVRWSNVNARLDKADQWLTLSMSQIARPGYRALCGVNSWHLMDVCEFEVASSISLSFVSTLVK
jgi:hypothetical protein